jgi:hypothetical protein
LQRPHIVVCSPTGSREGAEDSCNHVEPRGHHSSGAASVRAVYFGVERRRARVPDARTPLLPCCLAGITQSRQPGDEELGGPSSAGATHDARSHLGRMAQLRRAAYLLSALRAATCGSAKCSAASAEVATAPRRGPFLGSIR